MSPPLNACKTLVFCSLAAFFAHSATAQILTTQGVETAVSGLLSGDQVYPSASVNASGGFLVFQGAKVDGIGHGIGAVRLDSRLAAAGAPFVVNQGPQGSQQQPSVALLSGGGAMVTWQGGAKGKSDVFARFLRPDGTFLTGDIQVNPVVSTVKSNQIAVMRGYQNNQLRNLRFRLLNSSRVVRDRNSGAVAAALPDGGAVVAYSGWRRVHTNWMDVLQVVKTSRGRSVTNDTPQKLSAYQDWMQDVFLQRFDSAGRKVGDEQVANRYTKYNQRDPSITVLPDGQFVVVWLSENFVPLSFEVAHARVDIMARIFSASGEPTGNEFAVSTGAVSSAAPQVSAMSDGRFTIVWAGRDGVRSNGLDIYGRVYSSSGEAGEPFRVNTVTYGDQFAPRISSIGVNQMVVWTCLGQDKIFNGTFTQITREKGYVTVPTGQSGSYKSVYGRLFSGGAPVGGDVRINSTLGKQIQPQVTGDGAGRFLALWSGFEVATGFDLYSQAYGTTQPGQTQDPGVPVSPAPGVDSGSVSHPRVTLSGPLEKLKLSWSAPSGARYQVQFSADLKNWTNVGVPRASSGAGDSIGIDIGTGNAFYRLIKLP